MRVAVFWQENVAAAGLGAVASARLPGAEGTCGGQVAPGARRANLAANN